MKETIIYLIRHAETVEEKGIRNTCEDFQMINEKEILSIQGEEQSKRLSNNIELQNLDVIWSSNYTRAKATANDTDTTEISLNWKEEKDKETYICYIREWEHNEQRKDLFEKLKSLKTKNKL